MQAVLDQLCLLIYLLWVNSWTHKFCGEVWLNVSFMFLSVIHHIGTTLPQGLHVGAYKA